MKTKKTRAQVQKSIQKKLELVKKMKLDGKIVVVILETILIQAKELEKEYTKEFKKKKPNPIVIHDIKIKSKLLGGLINDMLQSMIDEMLRQKIAEKRKRKRT